MTSLFEIVDAIHLEAQGIDSIFRNKPRYLMAMYAKEGMKKLGLTFGLNIKGMNIRIPSSCVVYKPIDYEAFVRAYLINCDGRTIELNINSRIPSEIRHYLVDCDGSLIDGCNEELFDNCLECNEDGTGCKNDQCVKCEGTGICSKYCPSEMEQLISDIEKYKNSWIKEHNDCFEFSSDLEDMAVIIEYIGNQTDGIDECAIQLDDKYAMILEYYIKYRLLEGGQDTLQQSQYFRRLFKNHRDAQMVKDNPLTKNDLLSILLM